MTLEQLVVAVANNPVVSSEMYESALQLVTEMKETYTLEEYATLMYIFGKYQEQKGVTTYCGLRIQEVLNMKTYRILKGETTLNANIQAYVDETQAKVDLVLKMINRRFFNINLVFTLVMLVLFQFVFKANLFAAIGITALSFMMNMYIVLPKSKKRFIKTQMTLLKEHLPENVQVFESEIY